MRWFGFIGVCLCLFATTVCAETMYVDNTVTIGLRDEPGFNNKIRETIEAGPAEVVKTENDWSFVRLSDGREGWIANRFVTGKKPNALDLKEIKDSRKKYEKASEQITALTEENKKLKADIEKLASESAENRKKIKEPSASPATPKTEPAELRKANHPERDKPAWKNEAKKEPAKDEPKKAADLMEILSNLEMNQIIKGALVGVGILLLGYLLGVGSAGSKRRRSSYF